MNTFKLNTGAIQRSKQKNGKPFELPADFTKVPNALFRLYTRLPDFKADHILMYIVLTSFYNRDKGYAYPTQQQLASMLNCGKNKPGQLAKVLEKYRLIETERYSFGGNNIYYLYAPITDVDEFYRTFPDAKRIEYEGETDTIMKYL